MIINGRTTRAREMVAVGSRSTHLACATRRTSPKMPNYTNRRCRSAVLIRPPYRPRGRLWFGANTNATYPYRSLLPPSFFFINKKKRITLLLRRSKMARSKPVIRAFGQPISRLSDCSAHSRNKGTVWNNTKENKHCAVLYMYKEPRCYVCVYNALSLLYRRRWTGVTRYATSTATSKLPFLECLESLG
jgi:hypothetical protein